MSQLRYANVGGYDKNFRGTPPDWAEASRAVFGGHIDLDPCSCQEANDKVIRAERFYDKELDGLTQPWTCRSMLLAPPFSTRLILQFAKKFAAEWQQNQIGEAIIFTNLAMTPEWVRIFCECAALVAFPHKRIQFIPSGNATHGSNNQDQMIFYCGPNTDAFASEFTNMGCLIYQEQLCLTHC